MQAYTAVDQQLHVLSQTLTKANRTFLPAKDDDSHTNLYYDPIGRRILGRWIDAEPGRIMLSLHPESFQYEWIDDAQHTLQSFSASGKTAAAVEGEIESRLSDLGLAPDGFTAALHYDIPDYGFNADPFQPIDPDGLAQWTAWRAQANQACEAVLGYTQAQSEIRVWPHHFDTGIYAQVNARMGIGFGLAMADDMAGGPYFYLAGYLSDGEIDYADAAPLDAGEWKTGTWKGAVLPLTDIAGALNTFIVQTTQWYLGR